MESQRMSNLDNAIIYLAGPINYAKDDGTQWRNDFKREISIINPLIKVIDPTDKPEDPKINSNASEEKAYARKLRTKSRWNELKDYVKKYRHMDLRYVDASDCIVVYINTDVHMCGTYDEVFTAERQQKPILAIVEGGLEKLPDWMFAVLDLNTIFSSLKSCLFYLECLNNGKIDIPKEWVLFRKFLKGTSNV